MSLIEKELKEIIEKSRGSPEVYVEIVGKRLKVVRTAKKSYLFPTIVNRVVKG